MEAEQEPRGSGASRRTALSLPRFPSRHDVATWLWAARLDLTVLALLTGVAAVLRVVLLEEIPGGLHGDEAWTGLDARRVLEEGWVGPYVTSALGQPAGPLYFAAPFVEVFGNTVFSIRFAMAVLGIATVPVAYLTFRVMFDRPMAVFAALLLASSMWHLHYSRIAFMVISWPLMELITLLFLFWGMKTGRLALYGLAGLALGLGIYTYNAYPIFALPLGLFILWAAMRQIGSEPLRFGRRIALMLAVAVIAALPMVLYAADPDNAFLNHHRGVSLLETERWESGSLLDRADLLLDRTRDFITAAFWSGEPDGADGAGAEAMVDRVSLPLMIVGIAVLLWQWRRLSSVAVLLMIALLPLGTILTTQGTFRQTLGIVPFLAAVAAVPLAMSWEQSRRLPPLSRRASHAAIALVVAAIAYLNLSFYFGEYRDTAIAQFTFGPELADAVRYVEDLPGDPYVYFYSDRWSFDYEVRQYLAPDHEGEDRSHQFGTFSLVPNRRGEVVYLFLAPYEQQANEVARLFAGGELFESITDDGRFRFSTYLLPRAERFAQGPIDTDTPGPTPTAAGPPPGADERDTTRRQDLNAIQRALEEYRDEHSSYPNTGGGIQSLCAYSALDAGCELEGFLSPLPEDPLGAPSDNGYWYASDGRRYTLYAQRESDRYQACPEHPEHLSRFDSLLCVEGP